MLPCGDLALLPLLSQSAVASSWCRCLYGGMYESRLERKYKYHSDLREGKEDRKCTKDSNR